MEPMDREDRVLLDLSGDLTPAPDALSEAQENLISTHFTKCARMYQEIFKVGIELSGHGEVDVDEMLTNARESVLAKFKLECQREEELCTVDLTEWAARLSSQIREFSAEASHPTGTNRRRRPRPRRRSSQAFFVTQILSSLCACTISETDISISDFYNGRRKPTFKSYVGDELNSTSAAQSQTSLLSADSKKMLQLLLQLSNFEKHGVPKYTGQNMGFQESDIEAEFRLCITSLSRWLSHQVPTTREVKLKLALLELVESELAYLKQLKLIIDCFLAGISQLQSMDILENIRTETLFSNIDEVYGSNLRLWSDGLQPLIQNMATRSRLPLSAFKKTNAFLSIEETCSPYINYCQDQEKCLNYYRSLENNDHFQTFVTWFERRSECNRLKLKDFMAAPFQRITKYPLLLKAVVTYLDESERRTYFEKLTNAAAAFVGKINSALQDVQEQPDTEQDADAVPQLPRNQNGPNPIKIMSKQ